MNILCFALLLILACIADSSLAEETSGQGQFGFGRVADKAEIQQWDIDISPDGKQLPAGRGSVSEGKQVYINQCLSCHGRKGKGGIHDQLVERFDPANNFSRDPRLKRTIGNYWPYATTVFDYINRAMPQTAPGSLTANEVYSVTAYLLFLNGIIEEDQLLDADSLARIEMPAKQLFYWSEEAISANRP